MEASFIMALAYFEAQLDAGQLEAWRSLNHPFEVQAYLDAVPYSPEAINRSPLRVMRDRLAHCLDGALFAAGALWRLGYPPVLVQMLPVPSTDDDHILAIYKRHGCFGAVAKSNFVGLRFREAIYRTVRELVLSYFEVYFNSDGMKTLREYRAPLSLPRVDVLDWMTDDRAADAIEERLNHVRRYPLISPEMAADFSPMDRTSYQAGMLVVNPAGLYRPKS
jgi:hypothetical protein